MRVLKCFKRENLLKKNIGKRYLLTQLTEKRFLIDPVSKNNAIYGNSLTLRLTEKELYCTVLQVLI